MNNTQKLQQCMQQVGLTSFKALYETGLSRKQIQLLRQGQIEKMRLETLIRLSQVLQVSLPDIISLFSCQSKHVNLNLDKCNPQNSEVTLLKQEYQRLHEQLQHQRQNLWQEFQQATLQTLESFLLIWPTAAAAARKNPQAPAIHLLPLVQPIEQLLAQWNVEMIGTVGEETLYNPRWHQPNDLHMQANTPIRVTHVGYRQGDRLLYRARVKLISEVKN